MLSRTKTSGPDKKSTVLPVFVSFEAWVERPWLSTGFELWTATDLAFPRDYFLCLPTQDLSSTCRRRARYSDAVSFSRSIFRTLKCDGSDGAPLLLADAVAFWSEHSDRAGVDSWLAALLVPSDLRRFLGRWSVQASEDVYVRTAVVVCENLQRMAATHAKRQYAGGPDFFGEEHLLAQLKAHLEEIGTEDCEVTDQIARLSVANLTLPPVPIAAVTKLGAFSQAPGDQNQPSSSSAAEGFTAVEDVQGIPVEDSLGLMDEEGAEPEEVQPDEEEIKELLALEDDEEVKLPTGFLCSISQRGRFRRLHFAGFCWRIPGVHFLNWEDLGQDEPDLIACKIDARCSECFPADKAEAREREKEEAEDEMDDDGSSSTSSSAAASG